MPDSQASIGLPREPIALLCGPGEAAAVRAMLDGERVELAPIGFDGLDAAIGRGEVAAIIVGVELLTGERTAQLREAIQAEPAWSDTPIILLAGRDALDAAASLVGFGQIRIVERPLHRPLLITAIGSAIHSRVRQRKSLALSDQVLEVEEHFRGLVESHEASRMRQIADLEALSKRLSEEIDEHKRTEAALRESEELFRYTGELSQQVAWTAEPDGKAVAASPRLNEITGLSPDVGLQELLATATHPDDHKAGMRGWWEAAEAKTPFFWEFRLRLVDGNYRNFITRAVPRIDDNGEIVRWYGFIEDVTGHKLAAEALRLAEERYRLAARATNDAIWDWNILTGEVAWSDAAAAYLGNASLEHSTIEIWELAIHPDDRDRVVRSIRRAIDSDRPRWSAAYRMRKADGDYAYVYDRGFIIRDDGCAVRAVGAVVDLTERRRAESELRRTQAELIHISRVSAMGTMASTLAHELNQPLTAVTSYVRGSRRLLAGFDDPVIHQVCEALEFAEAGALRAGQIVRRLRELVARGAVEVRPENLASLVEDASVLAFVDEHLHGITHEIRIDPDAYWVEVDRIQIQQVLINLTRNAIQALQNSEERHVTIAARPAGEDLVEVCVADTGSGIPPSVREALFSPFHSTKTEGMGIGLSISRTIIEAHHGRIWAEDRPEGGTIFRFTLPRAEVPDEVHDHAESDAEQSSVV